MGKLNELASAIEKITDSVEKVHQDIAHKPIELADRIVPNLPLTKTVGDVQAKIISGAYDVVRGVAKALAGLDEQKGQSAQPPPVAAVKPTP
jgi:hypothetical protein